VVPDHTLLYQVVDDFSFPDVDYDPYL
jgi:hypothetical protein